MNLKEIILRACEIPAVPKVAFQVTSMLSNPNATVNDLQKVIVSDQALATRILRIANSSLYALRQNIDTISDAINIIGFNTIKTITLAASVKDVYKRFGLLEQKLWEHSIGVSVAASHISQVFPFLKREESAIAGLLHDVGKVIMNNSMPDEFHLVAERVYEEMIPFESIEKDIFGFGHAEVGYLLAEKWGFPVVLCNLIRYHHSCDDASDVSSDTYLPTLCLTVALADALCATLGVGYRAPMEQFAFRVEAIRKRLNISEERMNLIITNFQTDFENEKLLSR